MKKLIYLWTAVLLLKLGSSQAQCNLLCNGNFDSPFITSVTGIVNASVVTCWQSITTPPTSPNSMEVWGTSNPLVITPNSGIQFIELNVFNPSTVFQDFTAVPGTVLSLGFAHRGRVGSDVMRVEMGPSVGPYATIGTYTTGNTAWVNYFANYTVPTGLGNNFRIRFVSVSASGGNPGLGNFLDNVFVRGPIINYSVNKYVTQSACNTQNSASVVPTNTNLAYTYNWSPGGYTSSSVSNIPVGIYNITVTAFNGCTSVPTVVQLTVNPPPSIGLTVSNATLCTNALTSVMISANVTLTTGVTYNWMPGNLSGSSVNVSPTVSTIYTVTANSSGGCSQTATLAVSVTTNCCSQSTTGLTPLGTTASGFITPSSYLVASDVTLTGNTTLTNSELLFMPGKKIIVPSGVTLSLDKAHLYACGINMWKGIEVQDGGRIVTVPRKNTSLIEDAEVAIELDNISLTNSSPNAPIAIDKVIFNKNRIAIKISNSNVNLASLPIGITACVFTSRNMPFTVFPSALSWPNADNTPGNLRAAAISTTGLSAPYDLQNYTPANLKLPYPTQPAHIGIQILNVGNINGIMPAGTGVVIGGLTGTFLNDYNLFDGLGKGIEVTDAGLSTCNNVFQNTKRYTLPNASQFGGWGIEHIINSQMNAMLNLSPPPANQTTDYGNRFWNCHVGAHSTNVYDVNVQYAIFRSQHLMSNPGFNGGTDGLLLFSNRFNYTVKFCEFNNITWSLWMAATSGPYNINGANNGTYAGNIDVSQNYFGSEVASNIPITPNTYYSDLALTFDGSSSSNWQIMGNCKINSNKLDRVFRGIRVNDLDSYPVEIGGNTIYVLDDNGISPTTDQYGIYASNSLDNLFINKNEVRGDGPINPSIWNQRLKLIRSIKNQSISNNTSPVITCNITSDAYVGFEFNGPQPNTVWTSNIMYQKMYIGLELVNNGEIGTQGNPVTGCNDSWDDNGNTFPFQWLGGSTWQTWVDGSSNAAPGSFLWCGNSPFAFPAINGGFGMPFTQPSSLDFASSQFNPDCPNQMAYAPLPSQRLINTIAANESLATADEWGIKVFPNPSHDNVTITSSIPNEKLNIRILDVTGKVVYTKNIDESTSNTLDVSKLKAAIYFIEIETSDAKLIRKKLVKVD